jgi:hypothetical protein
MHSAAHHRPHALWREDETHQRRVRERECGEHSCGLLTDRERQVQEFFSWAGKGWVARFGVRCEGAMQSFSFTLSFF